VGTVPHRLRVLEDRVLRVLGYRVLRVLGDRVLRVLEDRVLRKIFGSTRDEVSGEWRRLHKEKHNDLIFSPDIIRVIKSRRITWVGHVACMRERRGRET
jgi:hypothetical protein